MNEGKKLSPAAIADVLRNRIRSGVFGVGDRLPTQAALAEEFQASRGAVRQALRALRDDGLLSDVSKGSPPRVAAPEPMAEEERPALVALAPRLEEAFSVPHVRIDASCLTAETLMSSMHAPVRLMQLRTVRPESIKARIVLPPRDLRRHYPAPVGGWGQDETLDAAVHRRSVEQHERQVMWLEGHFRMLRDTYRIDATVEFRVGDGTPFHKLYLLNDTEVLFAHYIIDTKTEYVEGERRKLRDAWGTESQLFSFHSRHSERDARFVKDTKKWFEALWETLSPDARDS